MLHTDKPLSTQIDTRNSINAIIWMVSIAYQEHKTEFFSKLGKKHVCKKTIIILLFHMRDESCIIGVKY